MKKKIEEKKTNKGDKTADMKDRENELNHHLELITNIAQRIDNENRALMKKNAELRNEYKSQENDRELLLKQLVMQKKENAKFIEEMDYLKTVIEEKQEDSANEEDEGFGSELHESVSMREGMKSREQKTRGSTRGAGSQRRTAGAVGAANIARQTFSGAGDSSGFPFLSKGAQGESEDQKVARYERITEKLKKMLEQERKKLKGARTMYTREIQSKTELEYLLRQCAEQTRNEILNKKQDPRFSQCKTHKSNDVDSGQQKKKKGMQISGGNNFENEVEFTQ